MKHLAQLALIAAAAAPTQAQDLFAARHTPARIERYSASTGALVNASFIDVDTLVGFGGAAQNLWDVVFAPNGEVWVSNYSAQQIHRFSSNGTAYLGNLPVTVGRAVGLAVVGSQLWVASVGGNAPAGVYAFTLGTFVQQHYIAGTNVWDVHGFGGQVLLCRSNGTIDAADPVTAAVVPFSAPGGFCEQAFTRASGGLAVADFNGTGYHLLGANGGLISSQSGLGAGNIRGVAELTNGGMLLNGTAGVYLFDPVTGVATQLSAGGGAFIGVEGGGLVSTSSCSSNPNSTGAVATLSGAGSNLVSANDVRLLAGSLPTNAFGFFLASRTTGNVANPGGSQGVLCLGGAIGRYVGPGQIQNSGASGTIGLVLNLGAVPQPTGPVAVAVGETWHFQAWYRDAVAGAATSNFTNGLSVGFQ